MMRPNLWDLRDRLKTSRERLESLAERSAHLRARLESGALPLGGEAPEPTPSVEARAPEPSREDGLFLGDDPWEIELATEEGK